jgi:uncharacterized membrane protein YkvA (DUF1232 family)
MEKTPKEPAASLSDDDDVVRGVREEEERTDGPQYGERFYDRVRGAIQAYIDKKGGTLGKTAEYLLLVPDVFNLLWRLVNDPRVHGKDKVLLGSAIAYFVFPFDFMPEAIPIIGAMGYLDDLVLSAYVLNRLITTDDDLVREHWAGSEDILDMIQRVLGAADSLIGSDVFGKVKKMAKKD